MMIVKNGWWSRKTSLSLSLVATPCFMTFAAKRTRPPFWKRASSTHLHVTNLIYIHSQLEAFPGVTLKCVCGCAYARNPQQSSHVLHNLIRAGEVGAAATAHRHSWIRARNNTCTCIVESLPAMKKNCTLNFWGFLPKNFVSNCGKFKATQGGN